jgi:putative hydrolase of the HAD superfamily
LPGRENDVSLLPSSCRAVFFDAVGTLLHPEPPAGATYAAVGRRFGSRQSADAIAARFRMAFSRQEEHDRLAQYRTSEPRELARWCAIVAEVLDDVTDPESCFAELYRHFAGSQVWRVEPGAETVLRELASRGLVVGLASNFDHRLRGVVAGLPELCWVPHLVISSEVGWRKPATPFFEATCQTARMPPEAVLFVGDDPVNDHDGAGAAGLASLLFDPGRRMARPARIECLEELL